MAIEDISSLRIRFADEAVEKLERLLDQHKVLISKLPAGDEKDDAENVLSIMVDALNEFRQYRELCDGVEARQNVWH
jgi:hypothetical protein